MSAKQPTPLERLLERCLQKPKAATVVPARCPKCKVEHKVCYLKGMKEILPGYYRTLCENCMILHMLTPKQSQQDLRGQLFLPLGLKAEDFTTPPVP